MDPVSRTRNEKGKMNQREEETGGRIRTTQFHVEQEEVGDGGGRRTEAGERGCV